MHRTRQNHHHATIGKFLKTIVYKSRNTSLDRIQEVDGNRRSDPKRRGGEGWDVKAGERPGILEDRPLAISGSSAPRKRKNAGFEGGGLAA